MFNRSNPLRPDVVSGVRKTCARVLLICGGTFLSLARHVLAAGSDIVVCLDVQNELELVRARAGVIPVVLASGQTLGTLTAQGCSLDVAQFVAERPGVNLNVGLGQLRVVGSLAAKQLQRDPAFLRKLVTEIFEPLLVKHNGLIDQVEITVCTSTAGGAGGPVGPVVAEELARLFEDQTDAVVNVQFIRVGSLSYVGLGERIHRNSAATLAEDVDYILASDRHAREVRSLVALELPMVGGRKAIRDAYVVQLAQALRSTGVREILQRCEPNHALDSRLGMVSTVGVSWWHGLPDRQIAGVVADAYVLQLLQILRAGPKPELVESVNIVLRESPNAAIPSLDELVANLRSHRGGQPAAFFEDCLACSLTFSDLGVHVKCRDTNAVNLSANLRLFFGAACASVAQFMEKVSLLQAVDAALERELASRTAAIAQAKNKHQRDRAAFEKVFRRACPRNIRESLLSMLSNPNEVLRQFRNAVTAARHSRAQLARLEAEAAELLNVRNQLTQEFDAVRRRLQRAIEVLSPIRPAREVAHCEPCVRVAELDHVLGELLEVTLRDGPDSEYLLRLLASCAASVTLSGLAQIAGAAEPRAGAIVRKLVEHDPPVAGPVWGARKPMTDGESIIVLPPLGRDAEDEIRRAFADFDSQLAPVCCDSAQGGVNILRLDIHKPRDPQEIFTPFIRKNLRDAWDERHLYFTSANGSCLRHLRDWLATLRAPHASERLLPTEAAHDSSTYQATQDREPGFRRGDRYREDDSTERDGWPQWESPDGDLVMPETEGAAYTRRPK